MEIVYILTNESMSGYVKIGETTNLEKRLRDLDNTSTPLPFECYYAAIVNDRKFVERQLHQAFEDFRVRKNREFFEVAPERVVAALKIGQIKEYSLERDIVESEDDQKALDKARERRSAFNFKIVDIPVGTTLTFTRDSNITCKVVDNKRVEFMDEITSLSASAKKALEITEGRDWKAVQRSDVILNTQ